MEPPYLRGWYRASVTLTKPADSLRGPCRCPSQEADQCCTVGESDPVLFQERSLQSLHVIQDVLGDGHVDAFGGHVAFQSASLSVSVMVTLAL